MHEIQTSHSLVVVPTAQSDQNHHEPKHGVWLKPNGGEVKLNTDGSRNDNPPVVGSLASSKIVLVPGWVIILVNWVIIVFFLPSFNVLNMGLTWLG